MYEGSLFSTSLTTFVTVKLFDDSRSDKRGFPGSSAGKESAVNAGDLGSIPGLGRSPGEGNGYSLRYSGLENSLYSPWGHKESDMSDFHVRLSF